MRYEKIKIGAVIRKAALKEKKPLLTEAQIEKLKTAGEIGLALIAVAGIISLSLVAPNVFTAIDKLFLRKHRRKLTKKERQIKVAQSFYYMKRKGLVRFKRIKGDFLISLTALGKKKYKKIDFETMIIRRPKKWDGKWWQVAADIPTKKYRNGADLLRQKLKDLGFFLLQRTLWYHPFDPREEVEFIVNHYGIERFVTLMEVSRLDKDDEAKLKDFFRKEISL